MAGVDEVEGFAVGVEGLEVSLEESELDVVLLGERLGVLELFGGEVDGGAVCALSGEGDGVLGGAAAEFEAVASVEGLWEEVELSVSWEERSEVDVLAGDVRLFLVVVGELIPVVSGAVVGGVHGVGWCRRAG